MFGQTPSSPSLQGVRLTSNSYSSSDVSSHSPDRVCSSEHFRTIGRWRSHVSTSTGSPFEAPQSRSISAHCPEKKVYSLAHTQLLPVAVHLHDSVSRSQLFGQALGNDSQRRL